MKRIANQWKDYECCDAGDGEKLERWQNIILRRPDPQAVWKRTGARPDGIACMRIITVQTGAEEAGNSNRAVPQTWTVSYKELTFKVSPTGFKHTGLFPNRRSTGLVQSKTAKPSRRPAGPDPEPVRLHRRSDDGVRQRRGR